MNKICTKCKVEKPIKEFYGDRQFKDGRRNNCKECTKVYSRVYRQDNRDVITEYNKQYRQDNKEIIYKRQKRWSQDNKRAITEQKKKRRHTDVQCKLAHSLRNRLRFVLKGGFKSGSAVRDLGCSIGFLKRHLESQFREGMSWNNHGEWHIDHIKPLSSFDLTNREELLKACHYTNLQPLWKSENLEKGDAFDEAELIGVYMSNIRPFLNKRKKKVIL